MGAIVGALLAIAFYGSSALTAMAPLPPAGADAGLLMEALLTFVLGFVATAMSSGDVEVRMEDGGMGVSGWVGGEWGQVLGGTEERGGGDVRGRGVGVCAQTLQFAQTYLSERASFPFFG